MANSFTGVQYNWGKIGIGGIPCTLQPWAAWHNGHIIRFCESETEAKRNIVIAGQAADEYGNYLKEGNNG